MTLTISSPGDTERTLREAWGSNLGRAALEALAVEGYRSGKLSRYGVQTLLGFDDRWETEEWLGARGVNQNYSLADLEADRAALAHALGPASH